MGTVDEAEVYVAEVVVDVAGTRTDLLEARLLTSELIADVVVEG